MFDILDEIVIAKCITNLASKDCSETAGEIIRKDYSERDMDECDV